MKRVLIMCFMLVIVFVLVGCDTKNKYSDEEHINNISKIIEKKYLGHDVTYKLRPIYNINDKLSYFVVDFSSDTYFYIKIQEKDNSAFFGYSLYTKDTTGKNSGPWKKSKFIEVNGITIEQFEKDEIGNDIFYYNSHFEVANIDNNTKCYLIELRNSDNNLIPAIKVGNGYLNLITDSEFDIYTSEKFPNSNIYFLPKSSFNL